jgi:hypothetical protein
LPFRPNIKGLDYYTNQPIVSEWFLGEGIPSDTLGDNGDFYINTLTFDIYQKVGGTWL